MFDAFCGVANPDPNYSARSNHWFYKKIFIKKLKKIIKIGTGQFQCYGSVSFRYGSGSRM